MAQGIVFAACGIPEKELFCSHQYGVVNMVVSAALRCVRVSHYDTQRILFRTAESLDELYAKASDMDFDDMYTFVPQIDILASAPRERDQTHVYELTVKKQTNTL